jgi:hypothetical protein
VRALPRVAAEGTGAQVAAAPSTAFSTGKYEISHVEAMLRVPNNDFRAALDQAEKLAADITRLPGFRAEIVESPLDVSSAAALQGRFGDKEAGPMEMRFVLRIVRERKGEA